MENKLTAVEFLINQYFLNDIGSLSDLDLKQSVEQAKEMEKGQIERAYAKGFLTEGDLIICCEQYIEETYGK